MNTDEGTQIKTKRRETIQRRVRRGRSAGCAEEGGRDPSPGVKQKRRTQDDDACRVATNRVGHGKLQTESSRTTIHISKTNFYSNSKEPARRRRYERQRQRRPAEAGRYKFKSNSNCEEPARRLPPGRLALLAGAVVDCFGCGFGLEG